VNDRNSVELQHNVFGYSSKTRQPDFEQRSTDGEESIKEQKEEKSLPNVRNQHKNAVEDVDAALEELGGFGRHQRKSFVVSLFLLAMGSMTLYPMGFYELQPKYMCASQETPEDWYACTNLDFCINL
jgi:hypothetical protein